MTRSFPPPMPRLALLLAGGLLAFGAAASSAKTADDAAVARVGTESIPRKALIGQLAKYFGRVGLEQMIDRALLEQEAAEKKVSLSDADVDARAAQVRKAAAGDFAGALEREGVSEDAWKGRVRYSLLAEKVMEAKWPVKDSDLTRLTARYIRVKTQQQARQVIQEARLTPFDRLADQDPSIDKGAGGLLAPEKFLRVDLPYWYAQVLKADLRPGQYTRQPIPSQEYFLVLKLDAVHGPETLKPREREQAVARIRAYRMGRLFPALRAEYKVQTRIPAAGAWDEGKATDTSELVLAGSESITRKELEAYLLEYYGKTALEQLVERSVVTQEAARVGVAVSDAELGTRASELQRVSGKTAFQATLDSEGITEAAWRERLRYSMLAEKIVGARARVSDQDLQRFTVRYLRARNEDDAGKILAALKGGTPFEQLAAQRGEGFINPKAFLRVDNPTIYKAVADAGVTPGQVVPRPVMLAGNTLVLRLEARFGPETMTAKERDDATRRINATRADEILTATRRSYKVEYLVPMKTLAAEARG